MKKVFVYSFVLITCLAAGCKKDNQNHKIYLLKQQITDFAVIGGPKDTTTYTYDDQNRVTTINDGTPPHRSLSEAIIYDSNNRISIARKYNNTGGLIIEYDFFYKPDSSGYYFYGPQHFPSDTAYFTFNDKNQVTKIQTKHSGSQEFTYDSKGNIITSEGFNPDGSNNLGDKVTYSYDDKKNPFSQTPRDNYFFMFIAFIDNRDVSSLINNVVVRNADTYTYTYNSLGFPIKAEVNSGTKIIPISFTYIAK